MREQGICSNVFNDISNLVKSEKFRRLFVPLTGAIALIWFLIRVIPKPSRAAYPCQRAAFPIASGFIIWTAGVIASLFAALKSYTSIINTPAFFILVLFFAFCMKNDAITTPINSRTNSVNTALLNAVVTGAGIKPTGNPDKLINIGFVSSEKEPTDAEVKSMVDKVIVQALGKKGLSSIIKPGYKVVIKVNLVGPQRGSKGEKGRGIITDPRIVRYVAEKIRDIIGFDKPADLKVIDGLFYIDKNPSLKSQSTSFYNARLERPSDKGASVYYDSDGDGILDGSSRAELVNCDAIGLDGRYCTVIDEPVLGKTKIYFPKFLRTKKQAAGSDSPDQY